MFDIFSLRSFDGAIVLLDAPKFLWLFVFVEKCENFSQSDLYMSKYVEVQLSRTEKMSFSFLDTETVTRVDTT